MKQIKSIRLSNEAVENLEKLSNFLDMSEGKIINILLTQVCLETGKNFGVPYYDLALRTYLRIKATNESVKE